MTVSGTILVDLTTVKADRQRNRVAAALADAPDGAAVDLIVGPLMVGPDAVRFIREYATEKHLAVNVKGETYAVQSWVSALRTGELLGMLL